MPDNPRMLGDLFPATGDGEGRGVIDANDLNVYDYALANNCARTFIDYQEGQKVPIDVKNGGIIPEQAAVASLHQNGFVSGVDRYLLKKYIDKQDKPTGYNVQTFIAELDAQEIIPPVDPEVKTLDEYRDDVTDHILDLKVYQADVMLTLQTISAKSLNDMWEKSQRLWGEAYRMDYDTIAQLDADMNAGIDATYEHADDSGWKAGQPDILSSIKTIIGTPEDGLNKAQCEEIRDKYWTPTAITFSDPPTQEERDKLVKRLISIPVSEGVDFYDTYKNAEHSGGGGDDPGESLVPADPETAPAASGDLATFISNCSSTYQTTFNNTITSSHPNQIITLKGNGGSDAILNCYEVSGGTWTAVSGLTNVAAKVGEAGIKPVSEVRENHYNTSRTPAGAWRLGNWSTCADDIGAFGKETRTGLKINYKKLEATMHWIDAGNSPQQQVESYPSWYNTFFDTAQNPFHLIQWKRADWATSVFYKSDKTTTISGADTAFDYGKYYANFSGVSTNATERLYDYVDTSYRNAIVIRFNMPPHVQKPITPDEGAGAGSAYFLHSSNNDSTPAATGGCVSVHNDKMIAILNWIDRTKSPFIFIGL